MVDYPRATNCGIIAGMQHARRRNTSTSATNRSAVTNGSRLLEGVDGRSASARRFRDLVRAFAADLGGELSELEMGLVRQAAAVALKAEALQAALVRGEPVDGDQLIRLSGTAKRILQAIGHKAEQRKPAGPTLHDHIARRAAQRVGEGA